MRALRFVVAGKLAHFRRFYTNSSSLTYPIPPPPTLRGLLGAAAGLGPEYAERFAEMRFAVRPAAPWRFLIQTLNHLKVKQGENHAAGGEHTQVPVQFLVPQDPAGRLRYEVLAVGAGAETLLDALHAPQYPLALGPAFALAFIEEAELVDGQLEPGLHGPLWGAFMIEALEELRGPGRILHDRYPLRLAPDRTLVLAKDLGLEAEGRPVEMRYNGPVFVSGERAFALVG